MKNLLRIMTLLAMVVGMQQADLFAKQAEKKNLPKTRQQNHQKKRDCSSSSSSSHHHHKRKSCCKKIQHRLRKINKRVKEDLNCSCTCQVILPEDFKDHHGSLTRTYVIDQPGSYCLGADIEFAPIASRPAIQILSDDVTLDLRDFRLSQANSTADVHGIVLGDATGLVILNNIIIQNGAITDFTGVGVKALNLTPSDDVVPFTNLHFFDLDIYNVGTSVAPNRNPYAASGIDLHSLLAFEFQGAPIDNHSYRNVLIKRCNVNNCLGNGAINIQTGINVVIEETNANDLTCNFGGFQFFGGVLLDFVSAYFILGDDIVLTKVQGNGTRRLDNTAAIGITAGLDMFFSNNVLATDCQFNDTFGLAGAITNNVNASGSKNVYFERCQFNNARAGAACFQANAFHASDLQLGRAVFGGKFVECQFNGASREGINAGAICSGPLIITTENVTFERCEATDIETNTATQTFGFRVLAQPVDPIADYSNLQNITFRDCVASNIRNGNALSGGHNAIGYQLGSLGGNRAGEQAQAVNYVLQNCIAEQIYSYTTNAAHYVAGIAEIAVPPAAALGGPIPQNLNIFIEGCRISDVENLNTTPISKSAGIVLDSVKRPVICKNSVSDCDRGILFTGTNLITPNNLFQLATTLANAQANPPIALDLSGNTTYSTGTASQTGGTVQGFGTAFTTAMVGGSISFSPVSGTASQTGNIVTSAANIFTDDMIGSTVSFPASAYSSYIVEYFSPTQVAVSTTLPAPLALQAFTVNVHAAPIAAVDVTNQTLTVVPAQNLPEQPFVITYGVPGGNHTFTNTTTSGVVAITPTVGTNINFTTDSLISNIDLNTANAGNPWVTGDTILYANGGSGDIPNLVNGTTYYLIVYVPGFTERGVVEENTVDNCKITGYQDDRPVSTTTAWISNVAVDNGTPTTDATNYSILWSPGPAPIDSGFVGGPYPAPGNKYYNLSLKP